MNESRIKNTLKNALTGFVNQFISLILAFITRTIFIQCLGIEFLGINSLFTNILQVLSMADLGFNTAMIYSMYKPIANKDKQTLADLMLYYKKIYNMIAVVILVIGLLLVPLLPYIVNTESIIRNLTLYYILYLLNTVLSYLFVYKTSIVIAHQKSHIINNYDTVLSLFQNISQIMCLLLFRNFTAYLLIQLLFTFIKNMYKGYKSQKMYPYIQNGNKLNVKIRKEIFKNIKSMFIYKVGGVLLNNTDNIIISMLIGTSVVGYYSNYFLIITAVTSFTNILFGSMTASIGNLNVSAKIDERYSFFKRINFLSVWIFTFCGVCFYVLLDKFIILWLGEEFVLDKLTLCVIVMNFVIPGFIRTVSIYRDTIGMFKDTKYVFFITSIINLILSLILGQFLGLFGILLATVIARLLTNVWFEPFVLYKKYFNKSPKEYFSRQILYVMVFVLCLILTNSMCMLINETVSIVSFIFSFIMCLLLPNMIMFLFYRKFNEFNYFLEIVKKITHNKL